MDIDKRNDVLTQVEAMVNAIRGACHPEVSKRELREERTAVTTLLYMTGVACINSSEIDKILGQ